MRKTSSFGPLTAVPASLKRAGVGVLLARKRGFSCCLAAFATAVLCVLATSSAVRAAQVDIPGPGGSAAFGTHVAVLPSGNIVVVDDAGPISNVGAVYLYSPSAALISSFTGGTANDHVGSGGIVLVGNGNFVVLSPQWNNGVATAAGAVTWVNGTTGLNGVVSSSNSLVGANTGDNVGSDGATVLSNGNYVLISSHWNGSLGAATWGEGSIGVSGQISASNSLVGTITNDFQSGSITALVNGNYVIGAPDWNVDTGAAIWCNGTTSLSGTIAGNNPLVGAAANDHVGAIVTALSNGNYVVGSSFWNGSVGAATWGSGTTGVSGVVSSSNSLVGAAANDSVGGSVSALSNGNYVVVSFDWNGNRGAATWGNGTTAMSGMISASNSLVGSTAGDYVGGYGVTALSNGNYVVQSPSWNGNIGAATWGNGTTGISGIITASNSRLGTAVNDFVGEEVTALGNGNYVVVSPSWNGFAGAVTWASGTTASSGVVSASNSLVGSSAADYVGIGHVTGLSNGNYVVGSYYWHGATGAATWGNGSTGVSGVVSAANSLVGAVANDRAGVPITALSNGNYVVGTSGWNGYVGAATWGNGTTGASGAVSASHSLAGTHLNDFVSQEITALGDGNYVLSSPQWNGKIGAVTLANGRFDLSATIQPWNSVIGAAANGGAGMVFAYDPVRQRLTVGRPADNIVSLFTMDQIFAGNFE
jgi:Repeat of unknown function (DUF5650)